MIRPLPSKSSRAVTVKPARKGGFDSETTPRECRGEVDVEEVGCECCIVVVGFGGETPWFFSGMLAGRTLNTNWLCSVKNMCMWPVCWGHMFFSLHPDSLWSWGFIFGSPTRWIMYLPHNGIEWWRWIWFFRAVPTYASGQLRLCYVQGIHRTPNTRNQQNAVHTFLRSLEMCFLQTTWE